MASYWALAHKRKTSFNKWNNNNARRTATKISKKESKLCWTPYETMHPGKAASWNSLPSVLSNLSTQRTEQNWFLGQKQQQIQAIWLFNNFKPKIRWIQMDSLTRNLEKNAIAIYIYSTPLIRSTIYIYSMPLIRRNFSNLPRLQGSSKEFLVKTAFSLMQRSDLSSFPLKLLRRHIWGFVRRSIGQSVRRSVRLKRIL